MNWLRTHRTEIVAWLAAVIGVIGLLVTLARLPQERQKMALDIEKLGLDHNIGHEVPIGKVFFKKL